VTGPSGRRRSGVNASLTPRRPRRDVENPEFAALFQRLLRAWTRRAGAGDLDALASMAAHGDEVDAHLLDAIAMLRDEPHCYSWQEIGDALGISRQAAQQRFGKVGGARRVGGQPGRLR
jgi:hypothetical protein